MKKIVGFIAVATILIVALRILLGGGKCIESQRVIPLPNVISSNDAIGFTCTGMTYNSLDSCWYIGNIGAYHPDEDMRSTIVVLSKDLKQIKRTIPLYELFPAMLDVQGVAVNEMDNSIYLCSFSENKVRHISDDNQIIDSISIDRPTGVAIDKKTGHLWVLTFSDLVEYDQNHKQLSNSPIVKDGQDQLAILDGKIYITHGLDYSKSQFVSIFDIASRELEKTYTVDSSYAIEGIAIVDSLVYIANDGLYHDAKINKNQINIYNLSDFK